jgi:hypothetical protein
MLSLLQKSDQAQVSLVPAWHPNFRNRERLPDTKVVRTQFFINIAATAVASALLIYVGLQEYRINRAEGNVSRWEGTIRTNKKASDQAIAMSKKFTDEERKIGELNEFLQQRLRLSEFFMRMSATLPKAIALDAVELRNDMRDAGVTVRGVASGTPDEASGAIAAYVERLRQDPYFSGVFDEVSLNRQDRDQASGQLLFTISLRYKGAPARK